MRTVTCESCKTTLPRHSAVLRGDLHGVKAWHPDCFTVARALEGVQVEEQAAEVGSR